MNTTRAHIQAQPLTCIHASFAFRGQFLENLGSGQFMQTHRGLLDKHAIQKPVAVDVKTALSETGTLKLLQEAEVASQFSHPKILRLVGVVLDRREGVAALYEHMEKGPLDRVLRRTSVSLQEKVGVHLSVCLSVSLSESFVFGVSSTTSFPLSWVPSSLIAAPFFCCCCCLSPSHRCP